MTDIVMVFSSPFGIALLGLLAGGIGWAIRETVEHIRSTPQRQHRTILELQEEMGRLRDRLENMELDLRKVNVRFFDLTTSYLTMHSKYSAVLSAVKYEGSDLTRNKVSRVLAVYGDSLDDFDADSPPQRLLHPALGDDQTDLDLT